MSDSPIVIEEHGPELRHHFVDAEQQRDAASLGMWLFLGTEIMFFGGMFLAYLVYRSWYYNEFAAGSRSINIWLGTINTAVLICSSLTVALGVRAAQMGKRKLLVTLLSITIVFGLAFLGIKGIEWYQKFEEHHVPGTLVQCGRHSKSISANSHRSAARATLFLSVFRHDRITRAAHDHRHRHLYFLDLLRVEGTLHAEILHAHRNGRAVLALRGYRLDLPFPAAVFDRSQASKVN